MGLNKLFALAAVLAVLAASTGQLPRIIYAVHMAKLHLIKESQVEAPVSMEPAFAGLPGVQGPLCPVSMGARTWLGLTGCSWGRKSRRSHFTRPRF